MQSACCRFKLCANRSAGRHGLKTAGGNVITASVDFDPHVIVDHELITGQNPRSDYLIAEKLIQALEHTVVAT